MRFYCEAPTTKHHPGVSQGGISFRDEEGFIYSLVTDKLVRKAQRRGLTIDGITMYCEVNASFTTTDSPDFTAVLPRPCGLWTGYHSGTNRMDGHRAYIYSIPSRQVLVLDLNTDLLKHTKDFPSLSCFHTPITPEIYQELADLYKKVCTILGPDECGDNFLLNAEILKPLDTYLH